MLERFSYPRRAMLEYLATPSLTTSARTLSLCQKLLLFESELGLGFNTAEPRKWQAASAVGTRCSTGKADHPEPVKEPAGPAEQGHLASL